MYAHNRGVTDSLHDLLTRVQRLTYISFYDVQCPKSSITTHIVALFNKGELSKSSLGFLEMVDSILIDSKAKLGPSYIPGEGTLFGTNNIEGQ